jgi:hypothetical protein
MLSMNNQLIHLPRIKDVWKLGATTGLSLGEFSKYINLKDKSHLKLPCSKEYSFVYNHRKEGMPPFARP